MHEQFVFYELSTSGQLHIVVRFLYVGKNYTAWSMTKRYWRIIAPQDSVLDDPLLFALRRELTRGSELIHSRPYTPHHTK